MKHWAAEPGSCIPEFFFHVRCHHTAGASTSALSSSCAILAKQLPWGEMNKPVPITRGDWNLLQGYLRPQVEYESLPTTTLTLQT